MKAVRSLLFNLTFFAWTASAALVFLPVLLMPRGAMVWLSRLWAGVTARLLRHIVGLDYEVRGRENLPDKPALFAFKHQSAWETIVLVLLVPDFAGVLKRELTAIPIFGWYMRKLRMIPIDRAKAGTALKQLVALARERIAEGRSVMVAPEGTRTAPGERPRYLPGVAAIYRDLGVAVVPVALNSGLFWGRRSFLKHPGVITVEFLPAIAPGLDRRTFLGELTDRIETASDRLAGEARTKYPWLKP